MKRWKSDLHLSWLHFYDDSVMKEMKLEKVQRLLRNPLDMHLLEKGYADIWILTHIFLQNNRLFKPHHWQALCLTKCGDEHASAILPLQEHDHSCFSESLLSFHDLVVGHGEVMLKWVNVLQYCKTGLLRVVCVQAVASLWKLLFSELNVLKLCR